MPKVTWGQSVEATVNLNHEEASELLEFKLKHRCEVPPDNRLCIACQGGHQSGGDPERMVAYVRDNSGPDLPLICFDCLDYYNEERRKKEQSE